MRFCLVWVLLFVLSACATPISCDDRDRDGGIGGTGTCERGEKPDVLAAKAD